MASCHCLVLAAAITGITVLYVTHDQEEALVMSDRIVVYNEGLIEQIFLHMDGVLDIRRFCHQLAIRLVHLELEIGSVEATDCLLGQNKRVGTKIILEALIVRCAQALVTVGETILQILRAAF